MVTRVKILPFIATLSGMLMASGTGLAGGQPVGLGQGDVPGFPMPAWIARIAYVFGSILLNCTSFGRAVLAIGAARLMGLRVDRVIFWTYVQSSLFASLAGVILAAQFGAGQPAEGVRWELFSTAAVCRQRNAPHRGRRLGRDDLRRRPPARVCSTSRTAWAESVSARTGNRWSVGSF